MNENFLIWHKQKNDIHEYKVRVSFHEREVWAASLGVNIGFEENGKGDNFLRPILVVKKFTNEILWAIPFTTQEKRGLYYFSLMFEERVNVAILSQFRLIDAKRLQYKMGDIAQGDFDAIKEKIKQLLT